MYIKPISHMSIRYVAKKFNGQSRFVDSVKVRFQGGKGGDGCISMMHLFANEFAGPDGGTGGNGGHVVLRASREVRSLNKIASSYQGDPGKRAHGKHMFGKSAEHTFVDVPVGTTVIQARPKHIGPHEWADERSRESKIVAVLDVEGSMFVAARGGAGGRGNASFLSNTNRHPMVAEAGAVGDSNYYELFMKLYAHLGLIGMPNAGKSSLLHALTGAQVKIGDYAFTTMHPQVGIVDYVEDDLAQVALSDLPGLVEESHLNRGLGVTFLRSLHRCASLLYVLDLTNDPVCQWRTLVHELESYRQGTHSGRAHIIAANKIDTGRGAARAFDELCLYLARESPQSPRPVPVSAHTGSGLCQLRAEVRRLYDEYCASSADEPETALVW